ncbi:MAG TPA: helix-turn-helix transcriptional regulator [Solirubrobacterales bacterium]|nr:helix-turn-helix transcriptional regulator [Solirubrobacterales bacterium]
MRKTRTDAGLEQKDLAELAEVKASEISRLEKGRKNPQWGTVKRVAEALGTSLSDLAALAEEFERRREADPHS